MQFVKTQTWEAVESLNEAVKLIKRLTEENTIARETETLKSLESHIFDAQENLESILMDIS